jgi:VCBS repeat-containing protein
MATIDLRRLDSNRIGTSTVTNGSDITWGEILTAFGSGQPLEKVLRDLYDQGLIKFIFTDGTVAQDVSGNAYRGLSLNTYTTSQRGKVVNGIEVEGSSGKDTIYGTDKAEVIRAGSGDDIVVGGGGADMQTGGRGKDTFAFKAASDSETSKFDTITDFKASEGDKIDLSALGQITWGGQKALGGGAASAWYTTSGSTASLWVDTNGDGSADMRIDLKGVTSIAQTDLIGVSKPATPPSPTPVATANPDTATITEDARSALVSGNVLMNDAAGLKLTTINGKTLSTLFKAATVTGKHGTLTIGQDGKWAYTLNNKDAAVQALGVDGTLAETFTYVATGKDGKTVTSSLTVTIKGSNDGPVAVKDAVETDEATAIDIVVLQNDTDKDSTDKLTVTSASITNGLGSVSINADGTIHYDSAGKYDSLAPGQTAQVVITYKISDGHGGTATSTATVTVTGKANGGIQTVADAIDLGKVVGTDQADTVVYSGSNSVGSAAQPFVLPDAIENFKVEGSGSLNIKGNSLNNTFGLGTAKEDNVDLSAGGADTVNGKAEELDGANITGFGADDRVVVEGASTVKIMDVTAGSAILHLDTDGNGLVDTTIRLEGDGLDGSTLKPNDFTIASEDDSSTIRFTPTNVAPTAQDSTGSAAEDTSISGKVTATDADEDVLTYSIVDAPAANKGSLDFKSDGTYTFTPAADFAGTVTFTYRANDGAENSNIATVTLEVSPVNDAPTAAPVAVEGAEEQAITGKVIGSDQDGDSLTYKLSATGAPENGTATVNPDGSFSYRGNDNFHGDDAFTVEVSDGKGSTTTAQVAVTVASASDAPVAQKGTISGVEDTIITGKVTATDADGDTLTYAVHGDEPAGLAFNLDGTYTFTPTQDFHGDVTFQFVANDGIHNSAPQTVTITVAPANDAPVAKDGSGNGDEDTTISGSVSATDGDEDALTYSVVDAPEAAQGTLAFNEDGTYTFTPARDFNGTATFTYRASDGTNDSNVATVTLTVNPVDDTPPVASITNAMASEADGEIIIPVALSYASSQDVMLSYEVSAPDKVITFANTTEGDLPAAYEGVRWTGIFASGDGKAVVATTGGGQFQSLDPNGFAISSLTVSSDDLNQLGGQQIVTIQAIKGGAVVATKEVTLNNGTASTPVTFGPEFSGIDAIHIDGAADRFGNDMPVKIDNVALAGTKPTTGTITIAAGQTTGTIKVPVVNDKVFESGETVTVRLTGGDGATLGKDAEAVGTITNDDAAPLPMITFTKIVAGDIHEGTWPVEFEVTRDTRLDEELTVTLESDLFGDQTVTFAPGETSQLVFFNTTDDEIGQPTRTYEIKLGQSPNYVPGATTSISGNYLDNDGGPVVNTPPVASSQITYINEVDFITYGGTYSLAAYGDDAQGDKLTLKLVGGQPENGTITFDPDLGPGALMFTPNPGFLDTLDKEETYQFTYQFTVSDGEFESAPQTGTVMVFGDGLPPGVLPTVSVSATDVTEGGAITYTFTRNGSTAAPLNVAYTLGGTAISGSDYTAPASSVTFAAGSSTAAVTVRTTNDTSVESAETVALTLAESVNYTIGQGTATSTIADNDTAAPALPTISVTDVSISEGGNLNFRFPMSVASAERLTVAYEIVFGTATADDISFAQTGTFIIAAGQANRGLNVLTIEDAIPEGDETVTFRITSVTTDSGAPGATIVDGDGVGTITNDDGPVVPAPALPTLSISDATVAEGDAATFTVTLSAPSATPVTVTWGTLHQTTSADDLPPAAGTLNFEPGQTSLTITVPSTEDTTVEGTEEFRVVLSAPSGATLVKATGAGTITNDDQAQGPAGEPGIIIQQTGGSTQVEEGGATDTFTIALANAPTADVTVMVSGDYFQVASNPDDPYGEVYLTFTKDNWNVPQTVTVTALDDADPEEAGTGSLYISTLGSADPRYNNFYPNNGLVSVSVTDNDNGNTGNTAPSALDVATDTYDTDLSLDVVGFGYDTETGDSVTYEILTQPAEGTVTVLTDGKFHFEGNAEFLAALKRGEIKPVTFQYQVSDGDLTSEPATITINVHGTNPGDETIQAFTRTTFSQTDFFPLDGKDGNDTVVFDSVTLTSGTGLEISLGQTIKWTEYAGKSIVNIENITIKNTTGNFARTMTVGGDDQANVITIENTNHKLSILGRGGDDTINFKGIGNGLTSVINGGAGDDTVNAYSAVIVNVADGNDTVNVFNGSNVTVQNFTAGDKVNFGASIEASNVSAAVVGGNTVFTINQGGVTSTVTVQGATNLVAGTDWTAGGVAEPPPPAPAVINAESASAEVTEGGIATFTFSRTGDLSQPLTVAIDTSFSSAVPGQDFTAPATITFAAGSDTATLEIQTLTDAATEGPATIEVRIAPDAGYTVGTADSIATDLIASQGTDPEPVRPSLSINDVTVKESAGTATFTVTLSAAAAAAVSVDYALAGSPAGLISPASGTLTFEPGQTTKTIEVPISDNATVATGPQKFVVNLSNVSANATLADLVGEGTIIEDDLPAEMPALTIATTTGLDENGTISWNAIPGAASYVLIGIEPDEPNFPPHTLGFAVAPNTSFAMKGSDEFAGMVVTVEARDADGNVLARSENQTDLIANVNDVPTGRPVISDNTPEVGQLLTISIGDLADGDGMRTDRPDEYGYIWERSLDGNTWALVSTTDSYQVTEVDAGYFIRGAARYTDRGDLLETAYSLTTAKVNDPNPNTPPVAFDDVAETPVGAAIAIDVLSNDFDFEGDAKIIESHGQGRNGTVTVQDGKLVYTPNANFVGMDTFEYTVNGGDTAKVTVTVKQEAELLTLLTVDNLDENSTLSWTAVPGAVSYVFIGLEPDDPEAPPHELGFALAPATSFNINGDDEFVGMAIHIEARDANGAVITRSVNETFAIANINDIPTGNLSVDDMTPAVGQTLTLGTGTFEDGDGYRDRGRAEEFEWAWERSPDGATWTTITAGPSPSAQSYTVTQVDNGYFLRGRAIYEDRAGDTIETVYSLTTGRVGAIDAGGGDGSGGEGGGNDGEIVFGSVVVTNGDTATELGADGSLTIKLSERPADNVTVTLSGDNQVTALGPNSSAELVFTPDNWDTPQTVKVIANEDGVEEGPHTGDVWFDTTSADQRFDGLGQSQTVNVNDSALEPDPIPEVTVAYLGRVDVTEGSEITFTFHRSEGTKDLAILWERMGTIDEADIAAIKWNGVEGGFAGFKGLAQTATLTIVLRDDTDVEDMESVGVKVLPSELYLWSDPFEASANVIDNDEAPVNIRPVVESKSVILTEDQMTAQIKPLVTDVDGNPTTIKVVGSLPTYVTLDEAEQSFHFNGEASAFDRLNDGDKETITFEYVANDGTEDSDPGLITITINGITDQTAPQRDVEPAPGADPYSYDLGNGGPAGQRTANNDILNDGTGLSSTIPGFGGNDTIYGRDGNDSLVGGNGNDTIYGGSGEDQINGDGGGTDARNVGASGDDLLYGGNGNDTINGQDGNDIILGGHGADDLTGGNGDDTFAYLSIFDRGDTVTMQGQLAANDVFDFREFDFGPNEAGRQGPAGGFQLFNQAPVPGQMVEDAFYYDASSGKLSINTGQDGAEDFSITVRTAQAFLQRLNNDDFLI